MPKFVDRVPVASGIYRRIVEATLVHYSGLTRANVGKLIDEVGVDTAAKIADARKGRQALALVDETEDAVPVLNQLGKQTLRRFLAFDLPGVDAMRLRITMTKMAAADDNYRVTVQTIERFTEAVRSLQDAGSLNRYSDLLQKRVAGVATRTDDGWRVAGKGTAQGALYEMIVDGLRYAGRVEETNPEKVLDSPVTVQVTRVIQGGDEVTRSIQIERIEVDSLLRSDVAIEMKSGGFDSVLEVVDKVARIKYFLVDVLGISEEAFTSGDDLFRVVVPDKDLLTTPELETIQANGGRVVEESMG